MTSEELKDQLSMRSVVESYGIQIKRDGMCSCPMHTDKTPSMKIYQRSFFCFSCSWSGDIFTFVQEMDGCDFSAAYLKLGGTYEKVTTSQKVAMYQAEKNRNRMKRERDKWEAEYTTNNMLIHKYRELLKKQEQPYMTPDGDAVYPDDWCYMADKFFHSLEIDDMLQQEGRQKGWLK